MCKAATNEDTEFWWEVMQPNDPGTPAHGGPHGQRERTGPSGRTTEQADQHTSPDQSLEVGHLFQEDARVRDQLATLNEGPNRRGKPQSPASILAEDVDKVVSRGAI